MRQALTALDTALPKLPWVTIDGKRRSGAIKFTEPEPQKEPKNLRKLKKAILKKWGTVALIDILKEAALRTGMLKALAPVGTREAITDQTVRAAARRRPTAASSTAPGVGCAATSSSPHGRMTARPASPTGEAVPGAVSH